MRFRAFSWQKAAFCLGYACLLLAALRQPSKAAPPSTEPRVAPQPPSPRRREGEKGSILARSIGLLFVATVVFALGAALGGAFAASADDGTAVVAACVGTSTEETSSSTETDAATTEETTTDVTTTEESPTEVTPTSTADTPSEPAPPTGTQPSVAPSPGSHGGSASGHEHSSGDTPVLHENHHSPRPPETKEGGAATIWLHRTLPDPTPPAMRLDPRFAALLRSTAKAEKIHWWPILAVLRAEGRDGHRPAGAAMLERVAHRLANHQLRLDPQERSLTHYNRAVGLRALVVGLKAAKPSLERRILGDSRIGLTAAGAIDIVAGRVDVRVLVAIRYLVVWFHQVTVSSLVTGHRFFARPGVMSAHVDGLAVDVSALKGLPIAGNQGIGGVAERAIEALLRLPSEVQPQQIISLLGLGGASFPQADHDDHLHIGF
jgi:hypothetical protein